MDDLRELRWPQDLESECSFIHATVLAYCTKRKKLSDDTAHDIAQIVFQKLWQKRDELAFQYWGQLFAYAFKVANSIIGEVNKRRNHNGSLEYFDDLSHLPGRGPTSSISIEEYLAWISEPKARDAVRMRLIEGHTFKAIGEKLGVSISTASALCAAGLEKVKMKLLLLSDSPDAKQLELER